jgi:hypothetical protein
LRSTALRRFLSGVASSGVSTSSKAVKIAVFLFSLVIPLLMLPLGRSPQIPLPKESFDFVTGKLEGLRLFMVSGSRDPGA